MNRRSLLQLFGVAALVPAITIPVALEQAPTRDLAAKVTDTLIAQLQEPLFADAYTLDGKRHSMPATTWRSTDNSFVVSFNSSFTGTIQRIVIRRGDKDMVYVPAADMDTPHMVYNNVVNISIRLVG